MNVGSVSHALRKAPFSLVLAAGVLFCSSAGVFAKEAGPAIEKRDCKPDLGALAAARKLIDPELTSLFADLPRSGERTRETMPAVRKGFNEWTAKRLTSSPPTPSDVKVEERYIPGPEGAPPIRILIYSPPGKAANKPALLDIHGGSWVLGLPEMNEIRNKNLSKDLGAVVVSIDYRLAPENPFPAQSDDSHAALAWLHGAAKELGVDPAKIAVSGDSAGGAIAAGLALRMRDEGKRQPAFLVLIYPSLDDVVNSKLDPTCKPGTGQEPGFAIRSYLGDSAGTKNVSPYAMPARAESLAGLPPTFIGVGAVDFLAQSATDFAQRLMRDQVPTEAHIYPGAPHGFDMASGAYVSKQFYSDLRNALARAFGVSR